MLFSFGKKTLTRNLRASSHVRCATLYCMSSHTSFPTLSASTATIDFMPIVFMNGSKVVESQIASYVNNLGTDSGYIDQFARKKENVL